MPSNLDRQTAWELLNQYTHSPALLRHAMAVEGVMKHFAELLQQGDVEKWGIVGLLHDIDYEKYPEQHCTKAQELLHDAGVPQDYIHAVASHGWGLCSDVEPIETMEKVLFTIDELTGLVNAAAIMRPSKSVMDLELKSVKKKYKDARFAAGVDRSVIEKGCEMLGMDLDDVIWQTILGMRSVAQEIGLAG